MAGVFKRGRKWYARYRDADGAVRKEAGFTDKTATLQLAIRREHEADLVRKGLAERPRQHRDRLIAEDLTAFRGSLVNKDVSEDQVRLVVGRCERLFAGGGFLRSADIECAAVADWLAMQRKEGKGKGKAGMSVQTSNHYTRAVRQFTRWLHRHKRLREDPLVLLEMLNVEVDRRHDRRALSDGEVSKILAAARDGRATHGFVGIDRHMLYVVALSTGLRASELASLDPDSLRLLGTPPTVTVRAGYSKRRRRDVLPLPTDVIAALRDWLAGKPSGRPLWPGKWAEHRYAGKMLQVDLEAAGVPYVDREGLFADFHSLRHTFITNLARHGVPLTTAQKLARHSTPVLTAARYTHIGLADRHREVEKLPPLGLGRNSGRANGVSRHPEASADKETPGNRPSGESSSASENAGKRRKQSGEGGILRRTCRKPAC